MRAATCSDCCTAVLRRFGIDKRAASEYILRKSQGFGRD